MIHLKESQTRHRYVFWAFILIYLLIMFLAMRVWLHQAVIQPLVQTSQIQVSLFEAQKSFDKNQVQEILQQTQTNIEPSQYDYAILGPNDLVWEEFSDTYRLQQAMQMIDKNSPSQFYRGRKGFYINQIFYIESQPYYWLKYYPRSLFSESIFQAYRIFFMFLIAIFLILYLIYRWQLKIISVPIQSIREGIDKIAIEDYSFEYLGSYNKDLDSLGYSLSELSRQLNSKKSQLESSERRLSILLDYLTLGVILIDHDGNIQLMNPEAMFLMTLEELPSGKSYQSVLRSYSLVEMVDKAIRNNQHINDEIEIYVPNSRYIDVNIIPYSDGLAKSDSVLVLLYDITQVRRLETVRTEFVSNASHELRTPVTAIKGFAETLLGGAMDQESLREKFISIIYKESNRLEVLINDILELSRVEKQVDPIVNEAVDLVSILDKLVHHFSQPAKNKGLSLELSGISQVYLYFDEHRLEQVFINLIENAINYSDKGGKIEVIVSKVAEKVLVEVKDQGMGIPESDQERVFERFYRVDKGRSRNSGGTGLGLSIVRNLIKNMSGKISLDSQPGIGSTFTVELPIRNEDNL